jgi:class 3 adenylate cyclase
MVPQQQDSGRVDGERRVITVLFADVVGSTALAEQLDPEDWTELMNEAFHLLTGPIHTFEGTVARLMGDGLLAFFGAPVAHEDDPQRAALAALAMMDGLRPFGLQIERERGMAFRLRIGINIGPVVVAEVGAAGATEYTAMGDAVNIGARMEQTAAPGAIQVSDHTHRLIAPFFETEPVGVLDLKGKSEAVPTYRVLRAKKLLLATNKAEPSAAALVGRESELAELGHALREQEEGRGRIVCLVGEAGLGKSRLLEELRIRWRERHPTGEWTVVQGVPYDTDRPYGLFQNYVRAIFGVELDDAPEVIHDKLLAGFRAEGMPDDVVELCSVAFERVIAAKVLHDAEDFAAEELRLDIFEMMYAAFQRSAQATPTVLVVDDLQWADAASTELLMHLLGLANEAPLIFICAFRPDTQAAASKFREHVRENFSRRYTEIVLSPLDARQTDVLLASLLQIANLPAELHDLVLRKSDGNPYFVEEIVRALVEQGALAETDTGLAWRSEQRVEELAIPDTLQALLIARMDRLDQETRATLQLASVIGRSFYYRVLRAISESAIELDKRLVSLEQIQLLHHVDSDPELEYVFKHELARDAAYGTILNRRRREFHRRVGEAIEELFDEQIEEHAHRLGKHFELAGDSTKALTYYEMAGAAAAAVSAQAEAAGHFDRALQAAHRLDLGVDEIDRLRSQRATALT